MADDTAWQPPAEGDRAPSRESPVSDAPLIPTLPPAVVLPPPPPVPPSAWAPGGESTFVVPPTVPTGQVPPVPPGLPTPARGVGQPATIETGPLPTPQRGRSSKWLVGSAVAAVLAIGAAGIFAVSNLAQSTAGGSDSPADLGVELLAAIENEDVLGVIDVLVPGERESLGEPFIDLVSELQRLEILAETDLSDLAGLDIELSDEIVRTRTTNVDDIVNIAMSAEVVVSIDGAELPIGDLLTDNLPDDMLTEVRETRITETDEFDLTLTAVLDDGRWYFSLLHTIAELGRSSQYDEPDIPVQGVGFDGADSPEAAVDQMLDSIEALDLTGIIRSLDPSEAAALQRYAPLFLEEAEAELAAVWLDWEIVDRTVRIEGSGDRRTAFIDTFAVEGTFDGSPFSFRFDGSCMVAEMEGDRIEQCGAVGSVSDLEGVFGDAPELVNLIEVIQEAFSDVEPVGLELRSRDGEWFVSPIATVTDGMLSMLRALDRDELDAIIDAAEPAVESIADDFFGTGEDLLGSSGVDEVDDFDDFGNDSTTVTTEPPAIADTDDDSGWFDCYEFDTAEATTCFQSYLDSGEIGPSDIPVVLRHPECGYADAAWAGTIYQLPDDEFIAVAAGARGCFLDLLETGKVEAWELPDEILYLECFEGRNWYQVLEDPDYDSRFETCRAAAAGE